MKTRDAATAVMGNHEFNAICYHTPDGAGDFLRPHTEKNTRQHGATLEQCATADPEEWQVRESW